MTMLDRSHVDWTGWENAGHPLPGVDAHRPMMPYARSSADRARSSGEAGVDYREAAVFIGIEPDGRIALIERTPEEGPHGGQMALPGGAREAGETLLDCALREWREELGLPVACAPWFEPVAFTEVHVVPSGFVVRPYLAPVEAVQSAPDPVEVAAVHHTHLKDLVDPRFRQKQSVRIHLPGMKGMRWRVPGFALPGVPFVWGATALMLSEVAEWYLRWRREDH